MPDVLIELFSEEIPARMQEKSAADLKAMVTGALVENGLTYEGAREFSGPRRIALAISGLTAKSAGRRDERKGPRVGAPEKAVQGFLRGAGLTSIDDATVVSDPKKGDFYVAVIETPGRDAADILKDVMPDIIGKFPWPKSMRWGEASAEPGSMRWVRPLRGIVCTLGPETEDPDVLDFSVGHLTAGDTTFGHRFMAHDPFRVRRLEDYQMELERRKVIIDADRRKSIIETDAKQAAFAHGLELVEDRALLDEVAGLVEWPVVKLGRFEDDFLVLPDIVIQTTIRENQKCFVLKDPKTGSLAGAFILTANIEASDGGKAIIAGNEKVIRARLSDAKFFWDTDLKTPLEDRLPSLDSVTFHEKLGTQGERVERITALSEKLAPLVGADAAKVVRAAKLAKADLATDMVYEFGELQGFMGRTYAAEQGEDKDVALAIEDHYRPLGPSDDVPDNPVSVAVALADKLDILTGFWSISEKPTGSKDPYALRRAALGVIRIVLDNRISLPLLKAFETARPGFGEGADLLKFFANRLEVYLRGKGERHDLIAAVFALPGQDDLLEIVRRVQALSAFLASDAGQSLLEGEKRATNILRAEEKKDGAIEAAIDPGLFTDPQETALFDALTTAGATAGNALAAKDYETAMTAFTALREPVDAFFEAVLVNAEDAAIRKNRLALLVKVRDTAAAIADFSKVGG